MPQNGPIVITATRQRMQPVIITSRTITSKTNSNTPNEVARMGLRMEVNERYNHEITQK